MVNHPRALAVKVSLPRPSVQGDQHDSDCYADQQYAPLMTPTVRTPLILYIVRTGACRARSPKPRLWTSRRVSCRRILIAVRPERGRVTFRKAVSSYC
ncbi:DUF4387 family protein [Streptomyces mirabilis]|uniref:DUF4387 family protein n=1 Tax=Streptomyces mirabilis TaxID=68239 RepID=UPI0009A0DB18|nr:DUF4387 family protein [Streptomyces mirabilis]